MEPVLVVGKRARNGHLHLPSRRPIAGMIASGLLLCGLLAACGGAPSAPDAPATVSPTPAPTPTPAPAVTSAGYLHVLQSPWVMTYKIDPTGHLHPPVTQHVGRHVHLLAGEPQGRFVYAARGGWGYVAFDQYLPSDGPGGAIVTYAPDPHDGTLAEVSAATVVQRPDPTDISGSGWQWVSGGRNRVHGLWLRRWGTPGRHFTYSYVSVVVAGDGQLGPVSSWPFIFDSDPGRVTVDVRSDVLYKAGTRLTVNTLNARGGLEAHMIQPDGTLTRTSSTNLCFVSPMAESDVVDPLVAARGFLFASVWFTSAWPSDWATVCSYQGLRLKPIYDLGFRASGAEAFVPAAETEPVLLAMVVVTSLSPLSAAREEELRVFSMNGEGDLRLLDSEKLQDPVRQLLFHPSGRFLYVSDTAEGLHVYALDSSGQLELKESGDHAGGSMAITLEDVRAEPLP